MISGRLAFSTVEGSPLGAHHAVMTVEASRGAYLAAVHLEGEDLEEAAAAFRGDVLVGLPREGPVRMRFMAGSGIPADPDAGDEHPVDRRLFLLRQVLDAPD